MNFDGTRTCRDGCASGGAMIPRKLHEVWLGPREFPVTWANAWRDLHPGWDYRVWYERDIRALPLVNVTAFDAYLARGQYAGAADVARVEILLRDGGVYTDVDSEPLRSLEGAPFLCAGFVAAYAPPRKNRNPPGRIGNGSLAA